MYNESVTPEQPQPAESPRSQGGTGSSRNGTGSSRNGTGRLVGIAGAGVIAGLFALGATSLAQAQETPTLTSPATTPVDVEAPDTGEDLDLDGDIDGENGDIDGEDTDADMSIEDEDAIWEAFDTCLGDQGLDIDALEAAEDAGELTEADEVALDAAFEACDPILVEAFGEDFDDEFDDCDPEDGDPEDGDPEDEERDTEERDTDEDLEEETP